MRARPAIAETTMMKRTYFLSDAHLGLRLVENPQEHQMKLVRFLDSIKNDAETIYLMGDIFDFWFEFKNYIQPDFEILFSKLKELIGVGISVHFFVGNHDMWTFGYLEKEIGLIVHRTSEVVKIADKTFFLAHGHKLEGKHLPTKLMHAIFENRFLQKMFFSFFPPKLGLGLGYAWSRRNRRKHCAHDNNYLGENNERLVQFSKQYLAQHPSIDFFVFGHRHILLDLQLNSRSRLLILGDWINLFSYAVFDGKTMTVEHYV